MLNINQSLQVMESFARAEKLLKPRWQEMFNDVYDEMPKQLRYLTHSFIILLALDVLILGNKWKRWKSILKSMEPNIPSKITRNKTSQSHDSKIKSFKNCFKIGRCYYSRRLD